MTIPKTCFKTLKPTATKPSCQSTSKSGRETSALCLTGGVLEERVPGAQETPAHPLGACSAQHSISPSAEPAHLQGCRSHLLEPRSCSWSRKGFWRPRVDIGWNSHSQAFLLSLAQQCLGLHCLGPSCGLGLLPQLSRNTKKGPSMWVLSLSKAFRARRPTYTMPPHVNPHPPNHRGMPAFLQVDVALPLCLYVFLRIGAQGCNQQLMFFTAFSP